MDRGFRARRIVFAVLCVCFIITLPVYASESHEDKVFSSLSEAAEGEDGDIAEGFSGTPEEVGEFTLSFLSPSEAISRLIGITSESLPEVIRMLVTLTGLVALSAVCNHVCPSGQDGVRGAVSFLSSAAITSAIVSSQLRYVLAVEDYFERLGALMASMIPITGAVWAMGGNVSTAAVGTLTLGAMLGFVERFCAVTVIPVCCVALVAAICSALSGGGLLEGFSSGVKKVYSFITAMVLTVFVFCLGAQTSIAGAADTVTARSAKTVATVLIPNVGGAVGDTLRTVAGSVGYIKSVVGIGGIILLLALTLPTLITLLLTRGVFLVTSTVADMLGCKREQKLLSELGNVYGLLVGAVAISSVAFAVALGIFVKCAVAAG